MSKITVDVEFEKAHYCRGVEVLDLPGVLQAGDTRLRAHVQVPISEQHAESVLSILMIEAVKEAING